jgi:HK97 family phage portal protein
VKATRQLDVVRRGFNLSTVAKFFGLSVTFSRYNLERYVQEGYESNAALYSIINRIARTAASSPFRVYRIVDRKKHLKCKAFTGRDASTTSIAKAVTIKALAYEEDTEHPLNAFLERPNPWQSGAEFILASVAFKLITGNRMILLTTLDMGANAGRVTSMVNLPPQYISIKPDGLFSVGTYTLNIDKPTDIPAENIIHSRYFNPTINGAGEHLMGLSPLAAGKRILDVSDSSDMRSLAMMKNAGAAGIIFDKTVDGLSPEQAAALKAKINEEVLGLENAGTWAVANGDMGMLDLSRAYGDIGVEATQRYSLQQLCNIYGVPYVLFGTESSTYNNIREAKKELLTMAVLPELVSLRDDLNLIASKFGEDVYIDFDMSVYAELQEDFQKLADVYSKSWWTTGNEKRLAMGMDEDTAEPMMKKYLIPSGLQELGNVNMEVIDDAMRQADELDDDDEEGLNR